MRVLICGAGVAGLALARWLARDGQEVVLVERAPARPGAGYMLDCRGRGLDAVEHMGLLAELREHAVDLAELVYHDQDGAELGRFADDGPEAERTVSVLRGALVRILGDALPSTVDLRYGRTVGAALEDGDGLDVTVDDGIVERVDLLVGADGLHSRIRALAFGPEEQFRRDLGFHTAAYVMREAGTTRSLGHALHMIEGSGLQVGAYPLDTDRLATLFVHRVRPQEPLPQDPRAELRRRYEATGWIVPRLLEHCPGPGELYFDRVSQIEMPTWSRGRTVLLGDACQAMSLLTGQGAGMALAGAEALAQQLRSEGDIPAALARYEYELRPVVERMQAEGRALAEDFVPV
ncbi:FAD-dependent oxidoreductase [Brachybacterium sacelli]|uniref:2-polyprenyl-6-methoxyphenol hydroxylase-like FAD-dependent oxidoreductase n=1 Tax=Brachybacterium sacelli TaxID=173364 RepID=A0ABS4WZ69_9MICO|nr:FAD-dependent oxidoreductase [Brachybacterium sacelli]MBP2381263.1 2-polyprenyl-6-methoxyphenol hydroxylase-like FAD-dependent oxidoreductase [Brachybacterium sacelli]